MNDVGGVGWFLLGPGQHSKECRRSITSRSWRYCPQNHRESKPPITMTEKPTAASHMEYGGS